jgi:hypothetical protein
MAALMPTSTCFARLLLFLALPLLCGCPPSSRYEIYNNSSIDYLVQYTDHISVWKSQSLLILQDDDLNHLAWVKRSMRLDGKSVVASVPTLDIRTETHILRYEFLVANADRDNHFSGDAGSIGRTFQMEPDGHIYVVKAQERFPALIPTPQPIGYPVKPITETGTP